MFPRTFNTDNGDDDKTPEENMVGILFSCLVHACLSCALRLHRGFSPDGKCNGKCQSVSALSVVAAF
jgi:hypothetical protein